uniref:Box C/D snoRNA protein 1 n=1 Tax=Glossina brevipalpis TaxID=37001 RepID=A0A1A9W6C8_9MUSC
MNYMEKVDPILYDRPELVETTKHRMDNATEDRNNLRSRLGMCEVCSALPAKYTCPKCEVKTCSLKCVTIHKTELSCNGIRDRTKFIPLKQMTKLDFMSDYYFLEECTRYAQDRKTDSIKRYTTYNRDLPIHLNRLRIAARRRKTNLKFLLQNFLKHRENTTYYCWKTKKIFWRVKWIFVNANEKGKIVCYSDYRCDEDKYLSELLDKYVNPTCVEVVPGKKILEYYQSKGVQNIKVMLKAEGVKCSHKRYYLMNVNQTLKMNLAGKILVEYPSVYVSYEEFPEGFDIIDSDEDIDEETKQHRLNLQNMCKTSSDKEQKANMEDSNPTDETDTKEQEKAKKKKERFRKLEAYEKTFNNYLFTDEKLMEILSSSTDDEED